MPAEGLAILAFGTGYSILALIVIAIIVILVVKFVFLAHSGRRLWNSPSGPIDHALYELEGNDFMPVGVDDFGGEAGDLGGAWKRCSPRSKT